MWLFITENISTINGLILLLTLIILLWYTYETRKMRQSSEQSRLLQEKENTRSIDKDDKREKLTRLYILSQIDVLIDAVNNQQKHIEKFINDLSRDKNINLELPITVDFNTKRIHIIDSASIFEIFVLPSDYNSDRLSSFNSLLRQLDLIDGIFNSFKTSFDYIKEQFDNYTTRWNENLELIGDYHDRWLNDFKLQNIDPHTDPFLYPFLQLYNRWASTPDYLDMYVAVPNFITPVLQKARESQPNFFGETMFKPLLRCSYAFDNHKNLKQLKIKEFGMYKTQLEDISSKLTFIKKDFISI